LTNCLTALGQCGGFHNTIFKESSWSMQIIAQERRRNKEKNDNIMILIK
jgi:hypothetical protein